MAYTIKDYEKALGDPKKIMAAELLVANEFAMREERKTHEEIAKEVGVTRQGLYKWRKQDMMFIKYMEVRSDIELASTRATVDSQLIKAIKGVSNNGVPSMKALEMYYKLSGRLTDRTEVVQAEEPSKASRSVTDEEIERELEQLQRTIKH